MIKSSISECKCVAKERSYPRLKRAKPSGSIILFESAEVGTVVYSAVAYHKVGEHNDSWIPSSFEEVDGDFQLTLSNSD